MYRDKAARKAELKGALIRQLKNLIAPGIIALIILVGVLVIINYKDEEEEEEVIRVNGWGVTLPKWCWKMRNSGL